MTSDSSGNNTSASAAVALLLPGYSPSLEWLARAMLADHVILDDVHPFSRKSRVHRARIRTPDGHHWLTIPVVTEDRRKPIKQVRIDHNRSWLKHHWQALEFNYRNSLYFDYYEPEIRSDLETASGCEFLIDAIRHVMERQWTYLELSFPFGWMSDLINSSVDSYSSYEFHHLPGSKLADYSVMRNPEIWQEADSRNYQKPHPNAITPVFHIPEYRQHFHGFISGCSLLDVLFEYGPEAWQVLDRISLKK